MLMSPAALTGRFGKELGFMSRLSQTLRGLVRGHSFDASIQTSAPTARDVIARAVAMTLEDLEPRRLMSAGQLDTTYGSGGIAHTDFPGVAATDSAARLVSLTDGLLAIGTSNGQPLLV